MSNTTKHNHGSNFGRIVAGCPRCEELKNGAPAVAGWGTYKKAEEAQRRADVKAHFASAGHKNGGCGLQCTYGEW